MIDYYTIAGMVIVFLIAIITVYLAITSNVKKGAEKKEKQKIEELKAMNDLTLQMNELNMNIRNMVINDEIRDKRITKHGEEIDVLKDRVTEVEHKQVFYETNLQAMRERIK